MLTAALRAKSLADGGGSVGEALAAAALGSSGHSPVTSTTATVTSSSSTGVIGSAANTTAAAAAAAAAAATTTTTTSSEPAVDPTNDNKMCCICWCEPPQVLLIPCNHFKVCVGCSEDCGEPLANCPVCRYTLLFCNHTYKFKVNQYLSSSNVCIQYTTAQRFTGIQAVSWLFYSVRSCTSGVFTYACDCSHELSLRCIRVVAVYVVVAAIY
jgi:Zinc finger, C3HC4 type (RING finger)